MSAEKRQQEKHMWISDDYQKLLQMSIKLDWKKMKLKFNF